MTKIEDITRSQVAKFLPGALERTLESYRAFVHDNALKNTKEFADHHNACKVAIAHMELLIKLAGWADLEKIVKDDEILGNLFLSAQSDVKEFYEKTKSRRDLV